jgi:hypothetical protein
MKEWLTTRVEMEFGNYKLDLQDKINELIEETEKSMIWVFHSIEITPQLGPFALATIVFKKKGI